jgi:transposase
MRNVGLDMGANTISYCEVRDGQVVDRATVRRLKDLDARLGPKAFPARVAFEAGHDAWHVHAVLTQWGQGPMMVDTTRVKQLGIGAHQKKTDRIDAETLARALEVGRIPLAHVLSPARQELRFELGVRRALVETRAQMITTCRELARARGQRIDVCAAESFVKKVRASALDEATGTLLEPIIVLLELLDPQIAHVESKLAEKCAQESVIVRLATAPGVGLIVAATFVSVIDEAGRFGDAHSVQAYLGLVPCEDSSGGKRRLGSITKQGNSYARAMLVQAAWSILRCGEDSDPLVRWGHAIVERRGKRIAVIALARRLAGVLWSMWRKDTVYQAAGLGIASARGVKAHAQTLTLRAEALTRAARKIRRNKPTLRVTEIATR